jgi:putative oxidoreductase
MNRYCAPDAALPIMLVSAIALGLVHREWTLDQGQFAWMLLIMFGTIAIGGAGRYRVALRPRASGQVAHGPSAAAHEE